MKNNNTVISKKIITYSVMALMAITIIFQGAYILLLKLRIAFAYDQIEICNQLARPLLLSNDPVSQSRIESAMEGIRNYYPTGSKQKSGTTLDTIVENERERLLEALSNLDMKEPAKPDKCSITFRNDGCLENEESSNLPVFREGATSQKIP